jgi:hypothetical protein
MTFLEPRRWDELVARFTAVIGRMIGTDLVDAAVPLLAILLFILLTKRSLPDVLLPILLLQILAYIVSFSLSAFDPMWALGVLPRLAMSIFPAFALFLGARFAPPVPTRA